MIRIVLFPAYLRAYAGGVAEFVLSENVPGTHGAVLNAIEEMHPALRELLRDARGRHPFLRVFGGDVDLTLEDPDARLPDGILRGEEPLIVLAAWVGG